MNKLVITLLLAAITQGAAALDAPKDIKRLPGYAALENFVGRWTEKSNERTFLEVCDWYAGKFHVVCNAERKRPDATVSRSMSILSYVPDQGYVHVGIGSKGNFDTLQNGTFSDGMFEFLSTSREGGRTVVTRIRVGPFSDRGFLFVVDTSTDAGAWTTVDTTEYVRLE